MNDDSQPQSLNVFRGEERDWTQQYAAIGEFVVEFEWICWNVRHLINGILQFHGLNNWKLGEIILNQPSFSADPLGSCLASLVAETLSDNAEVMTKMKEFKIAFQGLIKVRNDLLHGSWLIGADVVEVTEQEQPTEIHGERRTPNKDGANIKTITTIAEVQERVMEAKRVKELCKGLTGNIIIGLHQRSSTAPR